MTTTSWADALDLFDEHLTGIGMAPTTVVTRMRWMRLFAAACPVPPADVTTRHINHWTARQTWKPATRKGVRLTLIRFFTFTVAAGITATNPAECLPTIRMPRYLPKPVDEATFRAALARTDITDLQVLALALGGELGMRRDEIVRAHTDHLGDRGLWVVGKGGHERLLPLDGDDPLRQLIAARPAGFLFPSRWDASKPMNVDALGKMIRRALGGGVGPHRLRHRCASVVYGATGDILAVRELLGHANVTTTQTYVKLEDAALRDALRAARARRQVAA